MKVFLILLLVAAVGFGVWFFGFRNAKTPAMAASAPKIAPPTTAGGIVDQTISTVQQGISIFNAGQDLWNKYAN